MIEKLTLAAFGKFKDRSFDLAPFTVFRGDNEAGKTTIFDALFDKLCGDERRGAVWTRLKDRYGGDRACEVKDRDGDEKYDLATADFLGLYGVRAGNIHIEADKSSSWIELAKGNLFSGGVDPARLARELARRNDYSGHVAHNNEIKSLGGELAQAEGELKDLELARQRVLASGGEQEKLAAALGALAKKLEEKTTEADKKQAEARALEAAQEREAAQAELELVEKYLHDQERLARLAPYTEGKLAEYGALKEKADKLAGEIGAARGELKALAGQAAVVASELALKEVQVEKAQKQSALAAQLLGRLAAAAPAQVTAPNQPLRFLTWGAGLAAAGFIFYLLRQNPAAASAAALIVLAFAGAAGYFISAGGAAAGGGDRALLEGLSDEWRNAGLDGSLIQRDTVAGTQEALIQAKAGFTTITREIETLSLRRREVEEKLRTGDAAAKELEREKEKADAAARAWLEAAACVNRDEYYSRVLKGQACRKEAAELQAGVDAALAARQAADPELLKIKLRLAIEDQARRSGAIKADRKALEAARAGFETVLKAKEKLAADKAAAVAALEGLKGQAAGGLSGLPENIQAARERIGVLKARIKTNKLEGEAAAIAAEIFSEMAAGSSLALAALAGDITAALRDVLPGAAVEISALALDSVRIKDAGGALRPSADISSGTRDCFMLAARLAIARKARAGKPGILVLDEPFYALDAVRQQAAVKLLKEFHQQAGWQVVLLTKDAGLAGALAGCFGDGQGFKLVEL